MITPIVKNIYASLRLLFRSAYLKKGQRGNYSLSLYDAWLFFLANVWIRPLLIHKATDGQFHVFQIQDVQFYWPANASTDTLTYTYCEVFMPALLNPHSYVIDRCHISPGDWVVDAGACEGFFTIYSLQRKANVCLIEPVPDLCDALAKTLKLYSFQKSELVRGLLGEVPGKSKLSFNFKHISIANEIDTIDSISIQKWTLDNLIEQGVIPRVDFLKADVEGGELKVLVGATQSIEEFRPKISLAVYHTSTQAQEILDYCRRHFEIYVWHFRGMYAWDNCEPRPYMLHGWPKK